MPYMPIEYRPYWPCSGFSQLRNPSSYITIFLPRRSPPPGQSVVASGRIAASTTAPAASSASTQIRGLASTGGDSSFSSRCSSPSEASLGAHQSSPQATSTR